MTKRLTTVTRVDHEKRDNYYDCWLLPNCSPSEALDLYWPTDHEFMLILNVVVGVEYFDLQTAIHGVGKEDEAEAAATVQERYAYLNEHLQELAHGYSAPLTSDMVLKTLERFEQEVVVPRLAE